MSTERASDRTVQRQPTAPSHHFCSVTPRPDIEARLHSSVIDVYDAGIKLDGRRNRARLVEVLAIGPGRWVSGERQPADVSPGQLVYIKERTVSFRLHLRKQDHFFIAMDAVMAELDRENLRLKPLGQFILTRPVEERARVAIMGDLPFFVGHTAGVEKQGQEADDIGCNTTRIEEVVAVGPGRFGGFRPVLKDFDWGSPRIEQEPWWETPDCKPGDLVVFTDMARPTSVTLAGRQFTLFEYDHNICSVLDEAAV